MYPFFGLTDEYKVKLHELIYDFCYYGNIEYFAIYEMPVQFRTFYVRKLTNMKEKEQSQYNSSNEKQNNQASSKIVRGPDINRA